MCLFVQVGFNKDGRLQAVDITIYANDGYTSEYGSEVHSMISFHSLYHIAMLQSAGCSICKNAAIYCFL